MARGPRDWSPRVDPLLAIKINAGLSSNGNPRKGWIIVDTRDGDRIDFVDEGYGTDLDRHYPDIIRFEWINVSAAEYREQLKFAREQAAKHRRGEI
jgi:hypothetical protein